jgi:hypothetical protein
LQRQRHAGRGTARCLGDPYDTKILTRHKDLNLRINQEIRACKKLREPKMPRQDAYALVPSRQMRR